MVKFIGMSFQLYANPKMRVIESVRWFRDMSFQLCVNLNSTHSRFTDMSFQLRVTIRISRTNLGFTKFKNMSLQNSRRTCGMLRVFL